MTPEEMNQIASLALAAMYSAVDEDGQRAVIVQAMKDAIASERERCAKIADGWTESSWAECALQIAASIRERNHVPGFMEGGDE